MPLGPSTTPIFQASFAANGLVGTGITQLSSACSDGLQLYMSGAGCTTISIDAGTLGAGTGIGIGIILSQPLLSATMTSFFLSLLIGGTYGPSTADAISTGIRNSLLIATINTVNAGVGIGTGKVQCIPNGTGGAVFSGALLAAGLSGSMTPSLGQAIGGALDASIASAFGFVVIAGPPSPLPGGGVGSAVVG